MISKEAPWCETSKQQNIPECPDRVIITSVSSLPVFLNFEGSSVICLPLFPVTSALTYIDDPPTLRKKRLSVRAGL